MRTAFFLVLLGLLLPLRAEDWTTSTGTIYQNVQVLSHNAAYVTILHEDGGGRIPLSTLSPALQKRFGYDPSKAPAILAATQAADQRDQQALAKEKKRLQAEDARQQQEAANALAAALFSVPAGPDLSTAAASPSSPETATGIPADDIGAQTEIDDWDFGAGYGGYYGYGGYGYGYGRRGSSGGTGAHFGNHSFSHR